jgi:hypothetical protein
MPPPSDDPELTGTPPHEEADPAPKKPMPPRRQTMEVQMAWLDSRENDPTVEQVTPVVPPVAPRKPPRLPGAKMTIPAMPALPSAHTKGPPPPKRITQEVEMSWVELVDDDIEDAPDSKVPAAVEEALPNLAPTEPDEKPIITKVEDAPVSTERLEAERAAVRAQHTEPMPLQQAPERTTAKHAPLDASRLAAEEEAERAHREALATRKAKQDEADRALRVRRKLERERERVEEEARVARRAREKEEEEERIAAISQPPPPPSQRLDLSGIDDEIDNALDNIFGPNLSYPPPAPDDDDKK